MNRVDCWNPEVEVGADPFTGQVQVAIKITTTEGPQVLIVPLTEDQAEEISGWLVQAARHMRAHKSGEIDLRLATGSSVGKA